MRKGYGPTGISYHYPLSEFKEDCLNGAILIAVDSTDWIIKYDPHRLFGPTNEVEMDNEISNLFDKIDCSVYLKKKGWTTRQKVCVLLLKDLAEALPQTVYS